MNSRFVRLQKDVRTFKRSQTGSFEAEKINWQARENEREVNGFVQKRVNS